MDLKDLLKKFGFSEKEIAVYSAILSLGAAIASDIAHKSNLNRSTTYVILESLMKRGFIQTAERRGIKMYQSAPADRVIAQFEQMAEKYSELARLAKKLLPKLAVKPTAAELIEMPKVRFLTGTDQMKDAFENVLSSLEDIRTQKMKPGMNIVGDKVFFISPDKKSGFVVESAEVARALKKSAAS